MSCGLGRHARPSGAAKVSGEPAGMSFRAERAHPAGMSSRAGRVRACDQHVILSAASACVRPACHPERSERSERSRRIPLAPNGAKRPRPRLGIRRAGDRRAAAICHPERSERKRAESKDPVRAEWRQTPTAIPQRSLAEPLVHDGGLGIAPVFLGIVCGADKAALLQHVC